MAFRNPFSDAEMTEAERVPLSDDILMHGLRMGTLALSKFGFETMLPIYQGQLGLTERETAIGMTFYRLLAVVRTLADLREPYQFQAMAATARTGFELCVDVALITKQLVPDGVKKFHAFTDAARFSAAYLTVNFYDANRDLEDANDAAERRNLVATPGKQAAVETVCQNLWGKHKAPEHWSGLRWRDQARLVGREMEEHYVQLHSLLAWWVHGGGAGVGGLPARAFTSIEVKCRDLLRKVVPDAFRQVGVELYMHRAVPDFFDHLDFVVTKIETLCAIDAKLQSLGYASKFA